MIAASHDSLPCGIEYGVIPLPRRHVVSLQIRVLAGACCEPEDKLGLARTVQETIDKGTQNLTGRQLSDAFDAIGATRGSGTGRETTTFTCTVLPEHLDRAVELHAELLRKTTFPEEAVKVSLELSRQELTALEDDAHGLLDKLISAQVYGPLLGRHPLGERETIDRIDRSDLEDFWRVHFHAGRMIISVAGPIEPSRIADLLAKHFDNFGSATRQGRTAYPVEFVARATHHHKELEQEQIAICWPGLDATHVDFPVQQAVIGILSGGMSGRLFTEVREKRGLVYWVAAWQETPRGTGMMFLGASTTPERCDKTYSALLREVDRLAEDITKSELDRAVIGIVASKDTRGDMTRAHCGELAGDLFFFGRPISMEEKVAKLEAVTVDDVRRYLAEHSRDRLSVVTLGPRPLGDGIGDGADRVETGAHGS